MIVAYHPDGQVPPVGERIEGPIIIGKDEERRTVVVPYVVLRDATIEEWIEDRRNEGNYSEEAIQAHAQQIRDLRGRIVEISVD